MLPLFDLTGRLLVGGADFRSGIAAGAAAVSMRALSWPPVLCLITVRVAI